MIHMIWKLKKIGSGGGRYIKKMVNIIHAYLEREKPSGVQNKGLPVSVCMLCYPKKEKKKSYEKRESQK